MTTRLERDGSRVVPAVNGRRVPTPDPAFQKEFADELRGRYEPKEIAALFRRFSRGETYVDAIMRRVCVRALARNCGDEVEIGPNVSLKHPETFEIGNGVSIAEGCLIHGRFDGRFVLGNKVWIGPQSFLDARDLIIEDYVGWGPGAKVLGSEHTGLPIEEPIIATDLRIAPVRVERWADVGTNAVLLPGVTIGQGAIVGAGAIVTHDVPPFAKVAGVPARVIGWRRGNGHDGPEERIDPAASRYVQERVGVRGEE